jgi:hypothetical protein
LQHQADDEVSLLIILICFKIWFFEKEMDGNKHAGSDHPAFVEAFAEVVIKTQVEIMLFHH